MMEKHFVIATAGHVDHGKSLLVKALTGTDPDRLPEEKARKITIELGFAELNLREPGGEEIHAAIVDVPGHEDFVRNMIAGVGSIDLALLVVAADDGWMPQTEEHVQILEYLGVTRAVVALTKVDISDADRTENEIREQLRGTNFADSPIVPVSVRTGTGLASLRDALASELSKLEPQRDIGKPRLFVDRAFTLHGVGTIVTGTLIGGTLRLGDSVVVQPRGARARVRSLQSHGRDVDLAQPGTRTAINLPDLAPGSGIARGDVVTRAGFDAATAIDVLLQRSARLGRAAPLRSGTSVYFHHGTTRIRAKLILLDAESLPAGSAALGRVGLSEPASVFVGDRFVIRDGSEQHSLGGGMVLDLHSSLKNFRAPERALLQARAAALADVDLVTKTEVLRHGAIRTSQLLAQSRFSAAEIAEALQKLHDRGEIFLDRAIGADIATWRAVRARAVELIEANHRAHPERTGLELTELRSALADHSPDFIDAVIVDLLGDDFVRVGSAIARAGRRPMLPDRLQLIANGIREALSLKPFDPPPRREIEPDRQAQQVLRFMIESGELIEVGADVILFRKDFDQMKSVIVDFISNYGPATVSELRRALESSRRIIVPSLERLDREGVTRRVGDKRVLA